MAKTASDKARLALLSGLNGGLTVFACRQSQLDQACHAPEIETHVAPERERGEALHAAERYAQRVQPPFVAEAEQGLALLFGFFL